MEPYLGQIMLFAGNFAPVGWLVCQGQELQISQYSALFSLLGTTYGGDGAHTFALPDLRGRVPLGSGQGPALSNRPLGALGGVEAVALNLGQLPAHTHSAMASASATSSSPTGSLWAPASSNGESITAYGSDATQTMSDQALAPVGGGQPHENMPPFLAMNFVIAIAGVFPPRP